MAKLVEDLKKEHAAIVSVLDQVEKLGISSAQSQKMLMDAKQGLLAHLKKEDENLYPALQRAAVKDPSLKRTLDMFAADMEGISKAAMDFFAKYAKGGSGIEFGKDLGRLFTTLKGRISKEENIVYKEYEKLNP